MRSGEVFEVVGESGVVHVEVCGGGVFALVGLEVVFAWPGRRHTILSVCSSV